MCASHLLAALPPLGVAPDADVQAIMAEQAALRRLATLAARPVPSEGLFAALNEELAGLWGISNAQAPAELAAFRARTDRG